MENIIDYLRNAKKGKEGFVFEFENYDDIKRHAFLKYSSGGRRVIDVAKVTLEIIQERIRRGDTYPMGEFGYPVEIVAREVLKLAPFASEELIKTIMIENRCSMDSFGMHLPKNEKLERKIKIVAEKHAGKCGFTIPDTDKVSNSQYERLMRFELWNAEEMMKIDSKLKEFFKEHQDEYFSARARSGR